MVSFFFITLWKTYLLHYDGVKHWVYSWKWWCGRGEIRRLISDLNICVSISRSSASISKYTHTHTPETNRCINSECSTNISLRQIDSIWLSIFVSAPFCFHTIQNIHVQIQTANIWGLGCRGLRNLADTPRSTLRSTPRSTKCVKQTT